MSNSQNGWPVLPPSSKKVVPLVVSGVSFPGGVHANLYTIFYYLVSRYVASVEPLHAGKCGGHVVRNIGTTTTPSNHASATAVDINWDLHADNTSPSKSMTPAQIAACHALVEYFNGVIRWGGDYHSDPDPMHWEINVHPGDPRIDAITRKINDGMRTVTYQVLEGEMPILVRGDTDPIGGANQIHRAQILLDYVVPESVTADGDYGPKTAAAVKKVMGGNGNIIDAKTWQKLLQMKKTK